MQPRDTNYQDPWADVNPDEEQADGSTQQAPLHPAVAAYLQAKQEAQAARDAGNKQGLNQDMAGAGVDVASAFFNRPSKQAVFLQHYNDTSAPKLTQGYQAKSNGDDLRASADKSRAEGEVKAGRIGKDFQDKHKLENDIEEQARAKGRYDADMETHEHAKGQWAPQDEFMAKEHADKVAGYDVNTDHRNPDSDSSKGLRDFIGSIEPALKGALGNSSYDDLSHNYPGLISAYEARKGREAAASARHEDKATARGDKLSGKQNESYTHMRKDLESFRGNATAQQASKDIYSGEKVLDIVKGKDPNTLTTQDLNLLAGEMAKIATGGVPTEHGIHALMPNNLQTKLAEMQSFLRSKPSDAHAGAYIRANMRYVEEMVGTAHGSLNAYRTNLAKGYKDRVSPEQYGEAMSDYGIGDADGAKPSGAPNAPAQTGPVHGADLP